MKKETKVFLVTFFVSGGGYASLMSVWHYADEGVFPIRKFLLHFILFGLFMSLFNVYNHRKNVRKDLSQKGERQPESKKLHRQISKNVQIHPLS